MKDVEVGEAVDGLEAIELAARKSPDIVLMDISMPGLNGVEAACRLMAMAPAAKVIMLSMHQDERRVVQSIRAGASGYLMKDVAVAEVATAINSVLRGEVFISASARKTVSRMLASSEAETSPLSLLTARQREILQLIAEGQSASTTSPGSSRFAIRAGLVSAEV